MPPIQYVSKILNQVIYKNKNQEKIHKNYKNNKKKKIKRLNNVEKISNEYHVN